MLRLSWCITDAADSLFLPDHFHACDRSYWPLFSSEIESCAAECDGDLAVRVIVRG